MALPDTLAHLKSKSAQFTGLRFLALGLLSRILSTQSDWVANKVSQNQVEADFSAESAPASNRKIGYNREVAFLTNKNH